MFKNPKKGQTKPSWTDLFLKVHGSIQKSEKREDKCSGSFTRIKQNKIGP